MDSSPFSPSLAEPPPQFPLRAQRFWRGRDGEAEAAQGAGAGGGRVTAVSPTAAGLWALPVLGPCCRSGLGAGKFGACLPAVQFCKQRDVISTGEWKLTRLSALKRMINKDQQELEVFSGALPSTKGLFQRFGNLPHRTHPPCVWLWGSRAHGMCGWFVWGAVAASPVGNI